MRHSNRFQTRRAARGGWKVFRARTNIKKQRKQRAQTADVDAFDSSTGIRVGKAMVVMVVLHVLAVAGFFAHNRWFEKADPVPRSRESTMLTPATPQTNDGRGQVYTCAPNDTFASVAAQFGISERQLRRANPTKRSLVDGTLLKVPAAVVMPDESLEDLVTENEIVRPVEPETSAGILVKPNRNPNLGRRAVETPSPRPQTEARAVPRAPQAQPAPQPVVTPAGRVHEVRTNDTLYRLSIKYGVSVDAIRRANGLQDNTIGIGQVLQIP